MLSDAINIFEYNFFISKMASSLAEEMFLKSMDTKYMGVAVEVFSLESVKNIKLIKPKNWIGDADNQTDLFEL